MMVCYPVFADAVKAQVMEAELQSAGMVPGVPMPSMSLSLPVPGLEGGADLSSVATITGAYLKAGAADEADSFGCAWLSAEDLEELTEAEAAKDTTVLVFPGATIAIPAQDPGRGCCDRTLCQRRVKDRYTSSDIVSCEDAIRAGMCLNHS